jgi:hypothetical protein
MLYVFSATDYVGNMFHLILIIISPAVVITSVSILLQLLDTFLTVCILIFVITEGFELIMVVTRISSNMLPA